MCVAEKAVGLHSLNRVVTYRAYRIDQGGSMIGSASVFEAPDDLTAISRARALMGSADRFEIWEGVRQVELSTLVTGGANE
jgi:hypothetical protein